MGMLRRLSLVLALVLVLVLGGAPRLAGAARPAAARKVLAQYDQVMAEKGPVSGSQPKLHLGLCLRPLLTPQVDAPRLYRGATRS